ncbi:MAG: protoporphyrinogen oxidase [Actinobacteria bacterium]|nr:protoporphyrinogen oxidase [Actinomycetota bacterium]
MKKIAIVGGGVAGLAAAHLLEEARQEGRNIDYVLFEKEDRLGGQLLTEKVDGFTIEAGPDCFISHKPQVIKMADKLGFSDQLLGSNDASKRTYVFSGGKLHKLPDGMLIMIPSKILPFAMSPLISWPGKIRMLMDLFIPKKTDDREESVTEFVTRRLGGEALDRIAEPLIAGIHGGDPDKMSINGMASMLKMEQDHGSLIRAMLAARKRPPGAPKDWKPGQASYVGNARVRQTFFMTFKNGMQELPERLIESCDSSKLLTGKTVTNIEKRSGGGYLISVEGMEPFEADAVIIATLAHVTAGLTKAIEPALSELVGSIKHSSSATVSLGYRKAAVADKLDGFGFVVPTSEKRKIMAATYSSSKWSFRTPDDDHVLIRAFVGGALNQQLVELDDGEMLGVVLEEIRDILGVGEKPVVSRIYRWFSGMPQYNVGHQSKVAKIMELAAGHEGLCLAGAAYNGVGVPDCTKSGLTAAEKALEFLKEPALLETRN